MSPKTKTVAEFKSAGGVRGALRQLHTSPGQSPLAAALEHLQAGGCGAWQGRTACGGRPTWVVFGGPLVSYALYRAVRVPGSIALGVVCDHHAANEFADMPADLWREQEAEFRKELQAAGASDQGAAARVLVELPLDADVLDRLQYQLGQWPLT